MFNNFQEVPLQWWRGCKGVKISSLFAVITPKDGRLIVWNIDSKKPQACFVNNGPVS